MPLSVVVPWLVRSFVDILQAADSIGSTDHNPLAYPSDCPHGRARLLSRLPGRNFLNLPEARAPRPQAPLPRFEIVLRLLTYRHVTTYLVILSRGESIVHFFKTPYLCHLRAASGIHNQLYRGFPFAPLSGGFHGNDNRRDVLKKW